MRVRHLALMASLAVACGAYAAGEYKRGVGSLEIDMENSEIRIKLELPPDSVAELEHPPHKALEKAALDQVEATLRNATSLFQFITHEAGCALVSAKIKRPDGDHKHRDIENEYVFRCASPEVLRSSETTLFRHFRLIYRLEAKRSVLVW